MRSRKLGIFILIIFAIHTIEVVYGLIKYNEFDYFSFIIAVLLCLAFVISRGKDRET